MRDISPLNALLPRIRIGVLAALLVQPEKAWYVAELAKRMQVPPSSLQRELHNLTAAGILKAHRQGRMAYYQANATSPLFTDLRGLLLKTAGMIDVLADVLQPFASRIRVAFVYGSLATRTARSDSDVDLMLVGTLVPADLALPFRHGRELLGRDINPTVYSPAEFRKKRLASDHFLSRVLDKPKLFVIGSSDELEAIAE